MKFVSFDSTLKSRVFVFCSVLALWFFSFSYINPWYQGLLKSAINFDSLDYQHIFYFSIGTTSICFAYYLLMVHLKVFRSLNLAIDKDSVIWGIGSGLLVAAILLPWASARGWSIGFNLDVAKMLGNLFSNTYEEFQYRVLILFAAFYAFKRPSIAIAISSLVFAWSHTNYPLELKLSVGIAGLIYGFSYSKTGSFVTAVLGHQVSDMILDTHLIPPS